MNECTANICKANTETIFSLLMIELASNCFMAQEAQATFLQGHLEENSLVKAVSTIPGSNTLVQEHASEAKTAHPTVVLPAMPSPVSHPILTHRVLKQSNATSMAGSYTRLFLGTWQCITTVTQSTVSAVKPGTKVSCDVKFFPDESGKILAHFVQPGWTQKDATVHSADKTDACAERTDSYHSPDTNEQWIAHSRDHFKMVDPNSIIVSSSVEQIRDGHVLGTYETRSLFFKIAGD